MPRSVSVVVVVVVDGLVVLLAPSEPLLDEPVEPVVPLVPVELVEPVDPVVPVDPVDPEMPVEPVDPVDPVEPTLEPEPVVLPGPVPVLWANAATLVPATNEPANTIAVSSFFMSFASCSFFSETSLGEAPGRRFGRPVALPVPWKLMMMFRAAVVQPR
jgi:hypothetical protein